MTVTCVLAVRVRWMDGNGYKLCSRSHCIPGRATNSAGSLSVYIVLPKILLPPAIPRWLRNTDANIHSRIKQCHQPLVLPFHWDSSPLRYEMRIREFVHIGFQVLWIWTMEICTLILAGEKKGEAFFHSWEHKDYAKSTWLKPFLVFVWGIWIFITFLKSGLAMDQQIMRRPAAISLVYI